MKLIVTCFCDRCSVFNSYFVLSSTLRVVFRVALLFCKFSIVGEILLASAVTNEISRQKEHSGWEEIALKWAKTLQKKVILIDSTIF